MSHIKARCVPNNEHGSQFTHQVLEFLHDHQWTGEYHIEFIQGYLND